MSIIEMSELAPVIASYLTIRDLTGCLRVSKRWYTLYISHVWKSFPPTYIPLETTRAAPRHCWDPWPWKQASKFLLYDFLCSQLCQEHQKLQLEPGNIEATYEKRVSVLSRHGHLIQSIAFYKPVMDEILATTQIMSGIPIHPKPTSAGLVLYALNLLPNLKQLQLVGWGVLDSDLEFWTIISNDFLPKLEKATISFDQPTLLHENRVLIPPLLFASCSPKMQQLKLVKLYSPSPVSDADSQLMNTKDNSEETGDTSKEEQKEEPLQGLKRLTVTVNHYDDYLSYWVRFLRRCINLEILKTSYIFKHFFDAISSCQNLRRLEIGIPTAVAIELLTNALKGGLLPSLTELQMNNSHYDYTKLKARLYSDLITSNRTGWRFLDLPPLLSIAATALVSHCLSTLEHLYIMGLSSVHMRQILSSSPKLVSFVTLQDWAPSEAPGPEEGQMSAVDFIDLDPVTERPRIWQCESTLKTLAVKITGIPRPDVSKTFHGFLRQRNVVKEAFPGQGVKLQCLVYERLARFTQLEELELGNEDRTKENLEQYVNTADGCVQVYNDTRFQYECVDLSLVHGLGQLSSLRKLRLFNFMRMATTVGIEEIQWMVEHWPKLERINGLDSWNSERKAARWLAKERPLIKSTSYRPDRMAMDWDSDTDFSDDED
ncbi:hypothetical protein FBU30_006203 [Linnemannia zychae]|nr:hypothetical protein FBU30_006203 [Linnemannia zychae]